MFQSKLHCCSSRAKRRFHPYSLAHPLSSAPFRTAEHWAVCATPLHLFSPYLRTAQQRTQRFCFVAPAGAAKSARQPLHRSTQASIHRERRNIEIPLFGRLHSVPHQHCRWFDLRFLFFSTLAQTLLGHAMVLLTPAESEGDSFSEAHSSSCDGVLEGVPCTPSRRSLKFTAGAHARHFLAFDTAISREERVVLFMRLFALRHLLVDTTVVPAYVPATYTPEELLEVRVVTDPRHPAYGQAGLYAKSAIPPNTIVTSYSGFIEVFATSCNSRTYTMGFGSIGDDYALDAEFVGNYGRYANDPRGVGTLQANLSAENRYNIRGESYTALVARRQIGAGEEILMSYGKAHRLSATPWVTVQGEPLMRARMGGVVPFPSFRTSETSPPAENGGRRRSSDAPCAGPSAEAEAISSSSRNSGVLGATIHDGGVVVADSDAQRIKPALSSSSCQPPQQSIANDLVWECPQCGMWTLCEASTADAPQPCSACRTPKLSGARLLGLLSSPAMTQRALLEEAGLDMLNDRGGATAGLSASSTPSSTATVSSTAPSKPFSSEHADWPMNVAFLPWQVWDAAVPLTVLSRHSRFETQPHLCLYTVDTGLGVEEKGRGHRRGVASRPAAAAAADVEGEDADSSSGSSRRVRPKPEMAGKLPQEDDEQPNGAQRAAKGDGAGSSAPATAIVTSITTSSRGRGRVRGRGDGSSGLKRGVMWQRQGDLDPEDLARLHHGVTSAAPHLTSSTASRPASLDVMPRSVHDALFTLLPLRVSHEGSVREANAAQSKADGRGDGPALLKESALAQLMAATQEVDRLLVLIRRSNAAAAASSSPSPSMQMASARRRLQCMTRRLFTGRSFQPGEVVSYIGGLVRQRGDSRCRVSNSCLEIPLRFFLPMKLRRGCGARAPHVDALGETSSGGGTRERDAAAVCDFYQHMDGMSLVVTNEFMYCPCVVWEEEEEAAGGEAKVGEVSKSERLGGGSPPVLDEVESALSSCNVALVLTLDTLGCPYACAVATKPIGAFEPLLARAQ